MIDANTFFLNQYLDRIDQAEQPDIDAQIRTSERMAKISVNDLLDVINQISESEQDTRNIDMLTVALRTTVMQPNALNKARLSNALIKLVEHIIYTEEQYLL